MSYQPPFNQSNYKIANACQFPYDKAYGIDYNQTKTMIYLESERGENYLSYLCSNCDGEHNFDIILVQLVNYRLNIQMISR